MPGGRWFAIHLFTLGVLSNLVVALSHHFSATLLQAPDRPGRDARFVLLNVGALAILGGFPIRPVLIAGALAVTAVVGWLLYDLRTMRVAALQRRFVFVVRGYERAAMAFLVGATLGALMGVGVLEGSWYGAGRLAHLHVNVLGWGGLTLLATVVFFGPTIMRARTEPGAERSAARALDLAAGGLLVAVAGLVLTGAGGDAAIAFRVAAGAGLGLYAAAATVVCLGVLRAGRDAEPSGRARFLRGACLWFPAVVWAQAVVVGAGAFRFLDALGVALLAGVLGQAILASLGHLAAVLPAGGPAAGAALRGRLERLPRARPAMLNVGVACAVTAALLGADGGVAGAVLIRVGWALIAAVALWQLGALAGSVRAARPAASA